MGYYPQESLYKPYKYHGYTVMGTLLGVHPIFFAGPQKPFGGKTMAVEIGSYTTRFTVYM